VSKNPIRFLGVTNFYFPGGPGSYLASWKSQEFIYIQSLIKKYYHLGNSARFLLGIGPGSPGPGRAEDMNKLERLEN
jgi:hypothetical protein